MWAVSEVVKSVAVQVVLALAEVVKAYRGTPSMRRGSVKRDRERRVYVCAECCMKSVGHQVLKHSAEIREEASRQKVASENATLWAELYT